MTPRAIATQVAESYGLGFADLTSPRRTRVHAHARQEAMLVLRQATKLSLPAIGRVLGRHHTTVLHGIDQVEGRMLRDPDYVGRVAGLIAGVLWARGAADGEQEGA